MLKKTRYLISRNPLSITRVDLPLNVVEGSPYYRTWEDARNALVGDLYREHEDLVVETARAAGRLAEAQALVEPPDERCVAVLHLGRYPYILSREEVGTRDLPGGATKYCETRQEAKGWLREMVEGKLVAARTWLGEMESAAKTIDEMSL